MKAKLLIVVFAVFCALFAGSLWWFQTRAFYERVEGVEEILVQGQGFRVRAYEGIDASSSPLKLRACFRAHDAMAADALEIFPAAPDPTPLVAPSWFECFDAEAIADDLAAGRARAVVAERDAPRGFDRLVALYPDGRGYMWRQLNETYAE